MLNLICLAFILSLSFSGLIVPYLPLKDPFSMDADSLLSPSIDHFFGTDNLGRDLFSRFLYGIRVSLLVGAVVAVISTLIGIAIGSASGYFGGTIDSLFMRITEIFQMLPSFFLALVLVAVFGPTIWNIVLVISLLSWPSTARLVRADFLWLRESTFVEAAKSIGEKTHVIILREILPNALYAVIVNVAFQTASAIMTESGLSFLGFGDRNLITWGQMLFDAHHYLILSPWGSIFPGLGILFTVLSLNVLGDGLNAVLNPRSNGI